MSKSGKSQDGSTTFTLSFEDGNPSLRPTRQPVRLREAYYYLANIDEYPEVLPLAFDIGEEHRREICNATGSLPGRIEFCRNDPGTLPQLVDRLRQLGRQMRRPWKQADEALSRRHVMHYLTQYVPTALVDGCWLQNVLRVATAHTPIGARMTGLYEHQVRAFTEDPGKHFVSEYRDAFRRLATPLEDVSSRALVERADFHEFSYELPVFLLSLGQFSRTYLPELLGVHLAWQFLELPSFGTDLIHDARTLHSLPSVDDSFADLEHIECGRRLTLQAVDEMLRDTSYGARETTWQRIWTGTAMTANAWTGWMESARALAPMGPPDPRQEMIDLLCRKAPHARGYHADKRLGDQLIDDQFAPEQFNPSKMLERLAESRFVKTGHPDKSHFLKQLVGFDGPMLGVFSPAELDTIREWIRTLPDQMPEPISPEPVATTSLAENGARERPMWSKATFRQRSERKFRGCSVRELYHYLVNVEYFPDILPVAEQFARSRFERSMASLTGGERSIPAEQYHPEALEEWVYTKHREQVDSYRPLTGAPVVSKEAFAEGTVQLAPLILIDGGWLQGMSSPSIIHTTVARMLFHVFYEEVGAGDATEHHANIYRDLLAAMGEKAPPVETMEFAQWSRLRDSSFDVPALWLSISCFPRHFMPEILGLNLAVEIAGLGGPYMEARDTLHYFGLPTRFVEVHNAADNVSFGHAAWAMDSIKQYLDEVAVREGPHNVDQTWRRVWSGVRATLPQIGKARLLVHRVRARLLGQPDPRRVPMIFRT